MNACRVIVYAMAMVTAFSASAHTTAESNMVVRAALYGALTFYPDNIEDGLVIPPGVEEPNTWHGFLGGDTNGWTLSEKKSAFDWYLTTLGTNDCRSLDEVQREEIGMAIDMCDALNHTNSVSSIKALALNPRGIYRNEAIELALKFSPVDDATTEFVETIITNVSGYSSGERVECYWEYAKKLQQNPCTNGVCASALSMFYRNRKVSGTGAATLDRLLSDKIVGYANSSNRLDTALSMLMVTNMRPQFVEYFVGVTNQLLSSGQPLTWINVGGGGN